MSFFDETETISEKIIKVLMIGFIGYSVIDGFYSDHNTNDIFRLSFISLGVVLYQIHLLNKRISNLNEQIYSMRNRSYSD
jgi:hypothetical protein